MIFSSAPNDFLNIKYSDELYHYGIKGQKWGIRRYQNSDGTLTAEGKERYRIKNMDSSVKGSKKDIKTMGEVFKYYTDKDRLPSSILGYKALMETVGENGGKDYKPSLNDIEWFNYEDQTIGLPEIAVLAEMGYNDKEIKRAINTSKEIREEEWEEKTPPLERNMFAWALDEMNYNGEDYYDKYINNCVKIAKELDYLHIKPGQNYYKLLESHLGKD